MAYRVARAGAYAAAGNSAEATSSLNVDIAAEINPIKRVTNVTKGIIAMGTSYAKGIWIGRAALGSGAAVLSCSLGPNYSVEHWAILINGTVYEVVGKLGNTAMQVVSKSNTAGMEWILIDGTDSPKSKWELEDKMQSLGRSYGYALVNAGVKKLNCQTFCLHMLAYAKGCSVSDATAIVTPRMGTALF